MKKITSPRNKHAHIPHETLESLQAYYTYTKSRERGGGRNRNKLWGYKTNRSNLLSPPFLAWAKKWKHGISGKFSELGKTSHKLHFVCEKDLEIGKEWSWIQPSMSSSLFFKWGDVFRRRKIVGGRTAKENTHTEFPGRMPPRDQPKRQLTIPNFCQHTTIQVYLSWSKTRGEEREESHLQFMEISLAMTLKKRLQLTSTPPKSQKKIMLLKLLKY